MYIYIHTHTHIYTVVAKKVVMCKYIYKYINTDHVISTECTNFSRNRSSSMLKFGKVHSVILIIQFNTEMIKNDEIELFLIDHMIDIYVFIYICT